jgi:hypothetical protein
MGIKSSNGKAPDTNNVNNTNSPELYHSSSTTDASTSASNAESLTNLQKSIIVTSSQHLNSQCSSILVGAGFPQELREKFPAETDSGLGSSIVRELKEMQKLTNHLADCIDDDVLRTKMEDLAEIAQKVQSGLSIDQTQVTNATSLAKEISSSLHKYSLDLENHQGTLPIDSDHMANFQNVYLERVLLAASILRGLCDPGSEIAPKLRKEIGAKIRYNYAGKNGSFSALDSTSQDEIRGLLTSVADMQQQFHRFKYLADEKAPQALKSGAVKSSLGISEIQQHLENLDPDLALLNIHYLGHVDLKSLALTSRSIKVSYESANAGGAPKVIDKSLNSPSASILKAWSVAALSLGVFAVSSLPAPVASILSSFHAKLFGTLGASIWISRKDLRTENNVKDAWNFLMQSAGGTANNPDDLLISCIVALKLMKTLGDDVVTLNRRDRGNQSNQPDYLLRTHLASPLCDLLGKWGNLVRPKDDTTYNNAKKNMEEAIGYYSDALHRDERGNECSNRLLERWTGWVNGCIGLAQGTSYVLACVAALPYLPQVPSYIFWMGEKATGLLQLAK